MKIGRLISCLAPLFIFGVILFGAAILYFSKDQLFPTPLAPEDTPWPASVPLISRADWGNPEIKNPDKISPMHGVNRITIHHDGLPPAPMLTETQIKKRVVAIRRSHSKKYADIGYHYIVDPIGRVWEGRPVIYQGAHAKGENRHNIGILFLGNTDRGKPTETGLNGLYTFIKYLRQRHAVEADQIFTHRELGRTECPGKHLQVHIDQAREANAFDLPAAPQKSSFDVDWRKTVANSSSFFSEAKHKTALLIELISHAVNRD